MTIDRIGRYRTIRMLGRRAEPRVFLAGTEGGAELVLEIAPLDEVGSPDARQATIQRFLDEARRLAALEHRGLARLCDFGEEGGVLWWVTEHVAGVALDRFTERDETLPPADALEVVAAVADALAAAHAAGVTHGAIRPSRLLRLGEREMKVVGFRPGDPVCARASGSALRYLSPEQVRGLAVDGRSDVFSLAVVLFELLTGASPFRGESDASTLFRIVHEEPLDPATAGRGTSGEVAQLLRRALAKEPEDRFPSSRAFAEALRRAAVALRVDDALGGATTAPRRAPPAAARAGSAPRSSLGPFVAGACAVLALAAAAVWFLRDGFGPASPPPAVWLEAGVRTEPAGLEVTADGLPLGEPGRVRFRSTEPFPVLAARYRCRVAEVRLSPADAGQVVVLVTDPVTLGWPIEAGVAGSRVLLNGKALGALPREVEIDLCRENRLELRAEGYRTARVDLPAGASPLEARKQLFDLALVELPKGRLALPDPGVALVFYVDGRKVGKGEREVVLEEGEHTLRFKNEYHWIDGEVKVAIAGGETATPALDGLTLATLVVQAFPPNCKVYLRRGRDAWRYLDETPAERRVAAGRYEVKVVLNPTGEEQVRAVELGPGKASPVRFAFGGRG